MATNAQISLTLRNGDVEPGSLRSREIADLIVQVEDMIATLVVHEEQAIRKDSVSVGLSQMSKGSLSLTFVMNYEQYTVPAFHRVAAAIARGIFWELPPIVYPRLREMVKFLNQRNLVMEFRMAGYESAPPLAVLSAEVEVPTVRPLTGDTTLYGEISRVGGAEPRIQFRTLQGQLLHCPTTEELAKQAGARLYEEVALRGQAQWSGETLDVEEFRVEGILDYKRTDPSSAFAALAALVNESFYAVGSEDHFLSMLHETETETWT